MTHDNNTGYPQFQLHRALHTANTHADDETRRRARKKVEKWMSAIQRMNSAEIIVGSRTPVQDAPAWLTLEVVTGGFATGELAAAGTLLPFECDLRDEILSGQQAKEGARDDRTLLNYYFITDHGFDDLLQRLETGSFHVTVPEEGALLVAAWLAKNDFKAEAIALIDQLTPFFDRVRFYPQPASCSQSSAGKVYLRDVRTVCDDLTKIGTPQQLLAQNEAVRIWELFREKVVSFVLSACDGVGPRIESQTDEDQHEVTETVTGDLPQLTAVHLLQARELNVEYASLLQAHRNCQKPLRKNSLAQTMDILDRFAKNESISSASRKRLGVLCGRYVAKRGVPGSSQHVAYRERQQRQVDMPLFVEVAKVLLSRLAVLPQTSGVEDFDEISAEVRPDEANEGVSVGTRLPASMLRKLERCMLASVNVLVEKKVIKSADSLAIVLPQVTGNLRANGIENASLRALYGAVYQAFRKRRSLLLTNYEHQVQMEELPWIAVVDRFRQATTSNKAAAFSAGREIAKLAIQNYPFAIVPNKLLQEFRAIAKSSDVKLPLVDELAADIFMGDFTRKFAAAAQIAGGLLKGTLYETYYEIDFDEILAIDVVPKKRLLGRQQSSGTCQRFGEICKRRSIEGKGSYVAKNGTIIEQQQILTTQNLATILIGFDLVDELRPHFGQLARNCFVWICAQLQIKDAKYHARLVKLKNSAYAWRQMVCFLSLASQQERDAFASWASEHLSNQTNEFQSRFFPAVTHLKNASNANKTGTPVGESHVPFLGWSLGKHWLLRDSRVAK